MMLSSHYQMKMILILYMASTKCYNIKRTTKHHVPFDENPVPAETKRELFQITFPLRAMPVKGFQEVTVNSLIGWFNTTSDCAHQIEYEMDISIASNNGNYSNNSSHIRAEEKLSIVHQDFENQDEILFQYDGSKLWPKLFKAEGYTYVVIPVMLGFKHTFTCYNGRKITKSAVKPLKDFKEVTANDSNIQLISATLYTRTYEVTFNNASEYGSYSCIIDGRMSQEILHYVPGEEQYARLSVGSSLQSYSTKEKLHNLNKKPEKDFYFLRILLEYFVINLTTYM